MNVLVFSKSRQAIFPNRVEKESLSQSNDHISYTRGHANLFDKEIAFGITNWLSLQWSTVIFQDPSVGFRCQTGVVYVYVVYDEDFHLESLRVVVISAVTPQNVVFLIFCLGGQGEKRSF